ncbi:MAG: protein kinase [Phycisphaerae bacterium]|nr:protein kinase [Phycisphaerae bacterium]
MGRQPTPSNNASDERLANVLEDLIRRRDAGEVLSDEMIISEHPELMPKLAERLSVLRSMDVVERLADTGATPQTGGHTDDYHVGLLPAADQLELLTGYEVLGEIHRGGQAIVYKAAEPSTRRLVAIKVVYGGQFARSRDRLRFDDEVQILRRLNHPNIVAVRHSGSARGLSYFVMDFIEGSSLDDYTSNGLRPARDTVELFAKICEAVSAAHLKGIIHRDLKPGNIRIDNDGEPHILDFGLAKYLQEDSDDAPLLQWVTAPGDFVGTLPWASPEQVISPGEADTRSDVYALGLILYHMLTGQFPYSVNGDVRSVFNNIVEAEPRKPRTFRREIGNEIETIVLKCLAKEPERRYEHAGALARDLRRYLAGKPIEAKQDSAWYVLRRHAQRHRRFVMLAAISLPVVVFLLALTLAKVMESQDLARQRDRAMYAEGEAKAAHRLAEQHAERLRRQDYVNRIGLAQQAWYGNSVGRMKRMLSECPQELRGWEWQYLDCLSDGSAATLQQHGAPVHCVALQPNGSVLASGHSDGTITLWNVATGEPVSTFQGHASGISALAFRADGESFLSAAHDKHISVWETDTGRLLRTLSGHASNVTAVACSADGRWVVSGAADLTVMLWDAVTGDVREVLRGHDETVSTVAISLDSKLIASGSYDRTIRLWRAPPGHGVQVLVGHSDRVECVALSPNGTRVASGGRDRRVRIWDVASGTELSTLSGHSDWVTGVAFSSSGEQLASSSNDGTVRLWDVRSGCLLGVLRGHEGAVRSVALSPRDDSIFSAGGDGAIKRWDYARTSEALILTGHNRYIYSLSFSPDGKWLVSGGHNSVLKIWDVPTGREVRTLRDPGGGVMAVAFAPGGRELASTSGDRDVAVWDAVTGERTMTLSGHLGRVQSLAFSPDGAWIVCSGGDRTIRVWDAQKGVELRTLKGHTKAVNALAVSPDGLHIVSASTDATVRVWDSLTAEDGRLLGDHEAPIYCAAWSHDGMRIATGDADGVLIVWNHSTGAKVKTMHAHTGAVCSVAFMPDDRRIVSAGNDRTIRVWDSATGEKVLTLRGHADEVTSLAISPDGQRFASGSRDGTLRLWESADESAVARQQRHINAAARWKVDALMEKLVFADLVHEHLLADATLSEEMRTAALELVHCRGDDPVRLNNLAWEIARSPKRSAEEYRRAVRMAGLAVQLNSENASHLNTLGAAQYRAGAFAEAIETLGRSDAIAVASDDGMTHRINLAFIGLALNRLGRVTEAAAALSRLRALMEVPPFATDNQLRPFVYEAETAIITPGAGEK